MQPTALCGAGVPARNCSVSWNGLAAVEFDVRDTVADEANGLAVALFCGTRQGVTLDSGETTTNWFLVKRLGAVAAGVRPDGNRFVFVMPVVPRALVVLMLRLECSVQLVEEALLLGDGDAVSVGTTQTVGAVLNARLLLLFNSASSTFFMPASADCNSPTRPDPIPRGCSCVNSRDCGAIQGSRAPSACVRLNNFQRSFCLEDEFVGGEWGFFLTGEYMVVEPDRAKAICRSRTCEACLAQTLLESTRNCRFCSELGCTAYNGKLQAGAYS